MVAKSGEISLGPRAALGRRSRLPYVLMTYYPSAGATQYILMIQVPIITQMISSYIIYFCPSNTGLHSTAVNVVFCVQYYSTGIHA